MEIMLKTELQVLLWPRPLLCNTPPFAGTFEPLAVILWFELVFEGVNLLCHCERGGKGLIRRE